MIGSVLSPGETGHFARCQYLTFRFADKSGLDDFSLFVAIQLDSQRTTVMVMELDLTLPLPRFWAGGISRANAMVYLPGSLRS